MSVDQTDQVPYTHLAAVYDTWTAQNPYDAWAARIAAWFGETEVHRVLDLCCGTGALTELLIKAGFQVTGVDRSPAMLTQARRRLGPAVSLEQRELPDLGAFDAHFDAVTCAFDSVNYLVAPAALEQSLSSVAKVLRPGGLCVFDVNTRRKLVETFGNSHYGDVQETFGYVWRNRHRPEQAEVDFFITLFLEDAGGGYQRLEEHHTQRWFELDQVTQAASQAGFEVVRVTDDYSETPSGPDTLRQVWVLRRS